MTDSEQQSTVDRLPSYMNRKKLSHAEFVASGEVQDWDPPESARNPLIAPIFPLIGKFSIVMVFMARHESNWRPVNLKNSPRKYAGHTEKFNRCQIDKPSVVVLVTGSLKPNVQALDSGTLRPKEFTFSVSIKGGNSVEIHSFRRQKLAETPGAWSIRDSMKIKGSQLDLIVFLSWNLRDRPLHCWNSLHTFLCSPRSTYQPRFDTMEHLRSSMSQFSNPLNYLGIDQIAW